MILQNEYILIEISDSNGAVTRLEDKKRNIQFLTGQPGQPFRLFTNDYKHQPSVQKLYPHVTKIISFELNREDNVLLLHYDIEGGFKLDAQVRLDGESVSFSSSTKVPKDKTLMLTEYPIIGGLRQIGKENFLVHSFGSGIKISEPLENLVAIPIDRSLRFCPYPHGYSGATMQFYTYYAKNEGGLYFGAEDSEHHLKWLNFFHNGESLETSMMYGMEDYGLGKSLNASYPFVLRLLNGYGWEEACDKYRSFAHRQSWCKQGPATMRDEYHKAKWLLEDVGVVTFGINAGKDRSKYIERYHRDIGAPVFHILGPDWTNWTQAYDWGNPGSLNTWIPTHFSKENIDKIRECGDYFAPFEFDWLTAVIPEDSDHEQVAKNLQHFPRRIFSTDKNIFPMQCPCTEYGNHLHVERDCEVVKESGCDSMYYDISANNLVHICLSDQHGHKPGGGTEITKAYQKVYRLTREACMRQKDTPYFPLGAEMMNETMLPVLDYAQARCWGQPCSAQEMWPFFQMIRSGRAEVIPMFDYVYHEYGLVRMDGYSKLTEEVGDFFYDVAAKCYLWGGLFELNYEFSPIEAIDGEENSSDEHYFVFRQFGFEYSYGRARYLRQFVALRLGEGNKYLAYGVMRPMQDLQVPKRKKNYYHYNHGKEEIFDGIIELPAVRACAWRSVGENPSFAWFFANTEKDVQLINFAINPKELSITSPRKVRVLTDFDPDHEPRVVLENTIEPGEVFQVQVEVMQRKVLMVEVV